MLSKAFGRKKSRKENIRPGRNNLLLVMHARIRTEQSETATQIKLLQSKAVYGILRINVRFSYPLEVYEVAVRCEICGKGRQTGHQVSHSNIKTNRSWKPNIRKVRAKIDGTSKTIKICTRCLRAGKVERAG